MARKSNRQNSSPRELRLERGMTQREFWSPLGVTQSAGFRYESGRGIPAPVRELLRLAHVERIPLRAIRADDWAVAKYLKEHEPELFSTLKERTGNR
jgi:transcriptional regulator with XRE-family HTH domain